MFRIHQKAESWGANLFKRENSPFRDEFDLYYFFLITGIGLGLKDRQKNSTSQMKDMTKSYTKSFPNSTKYKIAGIVLIEKLFSSGFDLGNRKIVKNFIENTLNNEDGNTYLTRDSIDLMNNYAFNGFLYLKENLPSPPDAANFFVWFNDEIKPKLFKNFGS